MKITLIQKIIDTIRGKIEFSDLVNYIKLTSLYSKKIAKKCFNLSLKLKKKGFQIKQIGKDGIVFSNGNINCVCEAKYPVIVREIFADEVYKFSDDIIDNNQKYTVFDIGANHCYASLYFAEKKWCKHVYAFEISDVTHDFAEKNIKLNNMDIISKISLYKYGLGKNDSEIKLYTDGRDYAVSTDKDVIIKTAKQPDKITEMTGYIKQASKILKQIIEDNNIQENIIIKCDVEGAEYDIFNDLAQNYPEIFDKTVKIVGETHLGFDMFYEIIKPYEFDIVRIEQHDNQTCPFELSKHK